MVTPKPWHKNDPEGKIYNHSRVYREKNKFKSNRIANQVIIDQYWQSNDKDFQILALNKAFNGEALLYLTKKYEKRGDLVGFTFKFSFFKVEDSGHVVVANDGFELLPELSETPDGDQEEEIVIKDINQVHVTGELGNIVIVRFNKVKLLTLTFSPHGTKKLLSKSVARIGMAEDECWSGFRIRQSSPDSKYLFFIYTDVVYLKEITEDNRLEWRAAWGVPNSFQERSSWTGILLSGTIGQVCCYSKTGLLAFISFKEKKKEFQKLYALDYSEKDKSFSFYPVSEKRFKDTSYRSLYRLDGQVFLKNSKDEVSRVEL